jgi:hypothetical protein
MNKEKMITAAAGVGKKSGLTDDVVNLKIEFELILERQLFSFFFFG